MVIHSDAVYLQLYEGPSLMQLDFGFFAFPWFYGWPRYDIIRKFEDALAISDLKVIKYRNFDYIEQDPPFSKTEN